MMKVKSQKGFTLIELLIVIAILGILAAVLIPNVVQFIGKGKLASANTETSIIKTAMAAYAADQAKETVEDCEDNDAIINLIGEFMQGSLAGSYAIESGQLVGITYQDTDWEWDSDYEQWVVPED